MVKDTKRTARDSFLIKMLISGSLSFFFPRPLSLSSDILSITRPGVPVDEWAAPVDPSAPIRVSGYLCGLIMGVDQKSMRPQSR